MTRKIVVSDSTTRDPDAMPKITCIIPAYGEEEELPASCGSSKATRGSARSLSWWRVRTTPRPWPKTFKRVKLLDLGDKRLGKSHAVMKGLEVARHDIIMMLDADLLGLTHDNLSALMLPVLNGEVDVTMSLRRNSLLFFRVIGVDFVSGERVFRKEVLDDYERLATHPGYGLEVFFNQEVIDHKHKMLVVYWRNVRSVRVEEKYGFFYGLRLDWEHFREGYATLTLGSFLHQLWSLRGNSTRSRKRMVASRNKQRRG